MELAKKLNMTQQRISSYEKGIREPDIETLKEIIKFFGVSADYFLGISNTTSNIEKQTQQTSNNSEILTYYNQLNDLGKEKAINNIEDLTKIPEYTEKRDESQNA